MQFVGSGVFWGLDLAGCIRAGSDVIPTVPHPMETGISVLCHPPCAPGASTPWLHHSSRCCFAKNQRPSGSVRGGMCPWRSGTSGT